MKEKINDDENSLDVIHEKIDDLNAPGYQVEFDPMEAEEVGAFVEDALNEADALDSITDLIEEASE